MNAPESAAPAASFARAAVATAVFAANSRASFAFAPAPFPSAASSAAPAAFAAFAAPSAAIFAAAPAPARTLSSPRPQNAAARPASLASKSSRAIERQSIASMRRTRPWTFCKLARHTTSSWSTTLVTYGSHASPARSSRQGGHANAAHLTNAPNPGNALNFVARIAATPAPRECPINTSLGDVFFFEAAETAPRAFLSRGSLWVKTHCAARAMPRCASAPRSSGSEESRGATAQSPSVSASFALAVPRITRKISPASRRWEMKCAGCWNFDADSSTCVVLMRSWPMDFSASASAPRSVE